MEIHLAGKIGFCFGVKRAINIAEKTLKESKANIYSLGPLIHNPQVVDELLKKGLEVVNDIRDVKKGTIIISSHGAPSNVIERIIAKKMHLVDATCPFVTYAQNIVKKLKKEGFKIIIIGDKRHPEVKALMSLAGNSKEKNRIGVISQTTQNKDNFIKEIQDILEGDFEEVRIFNTICNDTSSRQAITRALLKKCDLMIVIGGKNSANTKRLRQICQDCGVDAFHIESDAEIKEEFFAGKKNVGIVSGASTPDNMVKRVVNRIKHFK